MVLIKLLFGEEFLIIMENKAEFVWQSSGHFTLDNMAACCSDQVNQQIKTRYQEVEESVDQLIDFYQRKISQGIKVGQQQ